jgi:hypothetical protein
MNGLSLGTLLLCTKSPYLTSSCAISCTPAGLVRGKPSTEEFNYKTKKKKKQHSTHTAQHRGSTSSGIYVLHRGVTRNHGRIVLLWKGGDSPLLLLKEVFFFSPLPSVAQHGSLWGKAGEAYYICSSGPRGCGRITYYVQNVTNSYACAVFLWGRETNLIAYLFIITVTQKGRISLPGIIRYLQEKKRKKLLFPV